MDSTILEQIRIRGKLLYRFRKNKQDKILYSDFCKARNNVQRLIKKAKSDFLVNKIEKNQNNSKELWKCIKTLGFGDKNKAQSKIVLEINVELCFEEKEIANHFNQFYMTIASKLVSMLPASCNLYNVDSTIFQDCYRNKGVSENSFKLKCVTVEYVHKLLLSLNKSKITGMDSIQAKFLKDGSNVFKFPLALIVNLSISTKVVPDEFKLAKVKPSFKKNSKVDVSNYRPVSILPMLMERAVYDQLFQYFTSNELIFEFQSGFRENFSTESCLIHLTDYIRTNTSKGLYAGLVLIDLQKAFDTVDHHILCNKLLAMGVHTESVNWFKSYLNDRNQIVEVNSVQSQSLNISCGVPQGSILGPLLFLAYVNDMSVSVSCKLLLYADDSILAVAHKDPKYISESLTHNLNSCFDWMVDNKLSINVGKTEAILLGSKRKLRKCSSLDVFCKERKIVNADMVKYLGLKLDQSLSGSPLIDGIVKNTNSKLKFLYKQVKTLNSKTKKLITLALIQPHLDYACTSWYSGLNKISKQKLQILQNKMVRFILDMGPREHVGYDQFSSLHCLDIEHRVQQLKLSHVFKVYHGNSPSYLNNNFVKVSDVHSYHTRSSSYNFHKPQVSGCAKDTFYSGIDLWNNLPNSIKSVTSKQLFRSTVQDFLLSQIRRTETDMFIFY